MYPHLDVGGVLVPLYTTMVLIGAISFVIVTILLLEKKEKCKPYITNRILIISIFGFILLVLFAYIGNSVFHSIESGRVVIGGISWLGGVLGAFPIMVILLHKFCPYIKGEALKYFNYLIPGITLAHGFGRIGCFLGGCCFGRVTDSRFGVVFPNGSIAASKYPGVDGGSLPVIPTQLYEAVFEFLLFVVMVLFYKKLRNSFVETYCFSYAIFRFVLEFWRGDDRGATGLILSPSQLMSLLLLIMGVLTLLYNKKLLFKNTYIKMQALARQDRTPDGINKISTSTEKLKEIKILYEQNLISDDEYTALKKQIFDGITKK